MQVLSPTAAPQGPAADQRTQPPGPKECPDASNGHGTGWTVRLARTDTHHRKTIQLALTSQSSSFIYPFHFFFKLHFSATIPEKCTFFFVRGATNLLIENSLLSLSMTFL